MVITIMVVLTGSSISIMIGISNAKVKSCAQSIYSDLNRVKTNTMAKEKGNGSTANDFYFSLYRNGDDVMLKERINGNDDVKKIGGRGLTVQYSAVEGGTKSALGSGEIKCKFNRSSGSVLDSDFSEIFVTNDHVTWKVMVYNATGKIRLEQIY